MLQISTAELAAKAEETRGQLQHLDQQVGLSVRVCVFLLASKKSNLLLRRAASQEILNVIIPSQTRTSRLVSHGADWWD